MRLWFGLLSAEFAKPRRLTVFRAVALALLLGPEVMSLVLRLLASEVPAVVESPWESVLGSVVLTAAFGGVVVAAAMLGREFDQGACGRCCFAETPAFPCCWRSSSQLCFPPPLPPSWPRSLASAKRCLQDGCRRSLKRRT